MRFCTTTLGCKVNQFETQAIGNILVSRGHIRAEPGEGCDVCIINTCAVTLDAARKSRQAVRRMINKEPRALIAVCGCFAQLDPQVVAELGADLVGGSGSRRDFAMEVEKRCGSRGALNPAPRAETIIKDEQNMADLFEELPPGSADGRTRALLKIQDVCDNFCAFCIVPHIRGRSRSLPLASAVIQARQLEAQGFREIVVTGIEICSYGKDQKGSPAPVDAFKEIGIAAPSARLRLGSLDPRAVTEDFCNGLQGIPNLCRHFHLSLQSGCDEILRRMGRRCDADTVRTAISKLRQSFPDCGVTADLIIGFPGETEEHFTETLSFIKEAAFSGMHIFNFSPRPGTPAADMPEQIPKAVRNERARITAAVAEDMARNFRFGQLGKTANVLFESKRGSTWFGLSDNYIEVAVKSGGERNQVLNVKMTEVCDKTVLGVVVDQYLLS